VDTAWDQHSQQSLASLQDELVRNQIRDAVGPFSPFWHRRLADLNRQPESVRSVTDLASLPAMGERDVSPDGDPAAMSALVIDVPDAVPDVRRTSRFWAVRRDSDQALVGTDGRPTSYVFSGSGFRFLLASTRRDLEVMARAGARLWDVLGLTRDDVLISAVPPEATTEHVALEAAALRAGSPAIFVGETPAAVAAAARFAPPSVLAVMTAAAPQLLSGLADLSSVRTLLLVGAPSDAERIAAAHALAVAGGRSDAVVLAVHAPSGARLLWGECRESGGRAGLHTYPDFDVVQMVDPETAEPTGADGELVLTQLGMRGSALLRWRTGDLVTGVSGGSCPSCGRVVPRVEGVQREALIARLDSGRPLDLRSIARVLSSRSDIEDWRVVVARRRRDGAVTVVVHFVGRDSEGAETVIGVATDMRASAGRVPTQLVASDRDALAALGGRPLSSRILVG
jgi:hypothetical protein